MRIHSDTLTRADFRDALSGLDGVWLEQCEEHRSTKRAKAFEVKLAAEPGRDSRGKARRPKNTGKYGSDSYAPKAATYDEHGDWMALLFDKDPEAIVGPYKGREHFHESTRYRYSGTWV